MGDQRAGMERGEGSLMGPIEQPLVNLTGPVGEPEEKVGPKRGRIRRWSDENPEGKELTARDWESFSLTHGWWMDLAHWGFGFEGEREFGTPGTWGWHNAFSVTLSVGPFYWYARLTWPEKGGE